MQRLRADPPAEAVEAADLQRHRLGADRDRGRCVCGELDRARPAVAALGSPRPCPRGGRAVERPGVRQPRRAGRLEAGIAQRYGDVVRGGGRGRGGRQGGEERSGEEQEAPVHPAILAAEPRVLRSTSCHDLVHSHQQAVRPPGPLRRGLVPAQPRREGRARRPERRRQDDAVPDDRRRGGAGRGRGLGAEEADDRLLPAGRRGDVGALGARRGDRRQRTARRPAPRARAPAARDGRPGALARDGADPRALRRGAGGVRPPRRLRARGAGARGAARARLRRRADRRRRGRALGRLEDARRDGARAARPAGRAADGRAHEPPRHRVDPVARVLPEGATRAPSS